MECLKSPYLPWKTIILLLVQMWYGVSWWRIISPIHSNCNSRILSSTNYKFHIHVGSWWIRLLVSTRWNYYTQQIQQDQCCTDSLVTILFLQTCDPFDFQIQHYWICVYRDFWKNTHKNSLHLLKKWSRMFSCVFQAALKKLVTRLHQTWGRVNACIAEDGHFQQLI